MMPDVGETLRASHLRAASDALGENATTVELLLTANWIRNGTFYAPLIPLLELEIAQRSAPLPASADDTAAASSDTDPDRGEDR